VTQEPSTPAARTPAGVASAQNTPAVGTPTESTPERRQRSKPAAVLVVLIGAGLVLATSGLTWASVTVTGIPGRSVVDADGRLAAPGAAALALVAAAGALAMATAGRWTRRVVAGLLVLAGLGTAALAGSVLLAPGTAVQPAVAAATGTVGRAPDGVATATGWPLLAVAGGLLIAAGGAIGLARGGRWPGPSRRYELSAAPAPAPASAGTGTAVSGPGGVRVAGVDAARSDPPVPRRSAAVSSADAARDARLDTWDRLSLGEDPTDEPV